MSKLSDSIQRDRFIDLKGQYGHNAKPRCIADDRSKPMVRRKSIKEIEDKGSLQVGLNNILSNI